MKELIITWQGLLFEAISFLIFTYLINLFLFKPIRMIIKKREGILSSNAGKQKNYEKLYEEAVNAIEKEKQNFKQSLNQIREDYYKEARQKAGEILGSAKQDAVSRFNLALKEIQQAELPLLDSIKAESKAISNLIAQKIIG